MFGIVKQRFPVLANGIRMKKVASSVSVVRYVTDYANLLTLGNLHAMSADGCTWETADAGSRPRPPEFPDAGPGQCLPG